MQVIHGTAQYQLAKLGKMALREVTALYSATTTYTTASLLLLPLSHCSNRITSFPLGSAAGVGCTNALFFLFLRFSVGCNLFLSAGLLHSFTPGVITSS